MEIVYSEQPRVCLSQLFPLILGNKRSSNKRRIVSALICSTSSECIKNAATFIWQRDWQPYAEYMMEVIGGSRRVIKCGQEKVCIILGQNGGN